eukprot:1143792-Pelagomonas_calceolata.AAC.6
MPPNPTSHCNVLSLTMLMLNLPLQGLYERGGGAEGQPSEGGDLQPSALDETRNDPVSLHGGAKQGTQSGGGAGSFQPGAMLWEMEHGIDGVLFYCTPCLQVIQRDFLMGANASEVVRQALATVPNPSGDPEVQQVSSPPGTAMCLASGARVEDT